MPGFSSPTLQRGVNTPPPTRPRLFARMNADRKSPPPPARLAPITPVAAPVVSPDHTPLLWSEESQRREHRQGQTLSAAHDNNYASQRIQPSYFRSHHREDEETLLQQQQQKVLLTPPRGGSGSTTSLHLYGGSVTARESSTGPHDADWTGHGRIVSMLTAKRERFVSSADTQHSMASSSTPPPRCRRAVNDQDNNRTPTRTADRNHSRNSAAVQNETIDGASAVKPPGRYERLQLSNSISRSSSSRDAISDSSSSDLVAAVAAPMLAASSVGGTTATKEHAASITTATATTQCLVLDDSVDSTAIVPAEQLQRLLEEAVAATARSADGYPAEPPTPYRRRLITAEVLRDWTGWEDLELVLATQLRVDAEAMLGVERIAQHLPRLSSLKLNGSRIPRLRQLGTGFHALKFLWLNSCHLTDLRGLAACCPALVELYASFNYITDVTPVMELSATLEVLDVEGNLLDDANSLGFVLSSLQKVTALSLQGNPLTCEHQCRVREAYTAAVGDTGTHRDEEAAANAATATNNSLAPLTGKERFTDVLRVWVRCLMPNLQTLNDEPIEYTMDDDDVTDSPTDSTVTRKTNTTTSTALRVPSARAVHVDPLDDSLAGELRLVAACVRETDPFDPLLEAVDEANQRVYTRPSTSCNGARPRLTPATAMGASRPSTSACSLSSSTVGATTTTNTTNASVLTTGAVLVGSATASLRRRLATPTPNPLTNFVEDIAAGVNRYGEFHESFAAAEKTTSTRLGELAHHHFHYVSHAETAEEQDARVAALLADDSEEDEWEHYKSSLLLVSSTVSDAAAVSNDVPPIAAHRSSLLSLSSAAHAHETDAVGGSMRSAEIALSTEDDGFDKELMGEWNRLRLRMAKAGRAV